jgi:hypothetical protein
MGRFISNIKKTILITVGESFVASFLIKSLKKNKDH